MRHYYATSLFLLFIASSLSAQTLTSDWFLQVGDSISGVRIVNATDFDFPTPGMDVAWDYSINAIPIGDTVVQRYVDPTEMETFDDFSDATLAFGTPGVDEFFFKNEADTSELVGLSLITPQGTLQLQYANGNEEIVAIAPMMLGDTIRRNVSGLVLVDGVPVQPFFQVNQVSIDGVGSLALANQTYENCLLYSTLVTDEDGIVQARSSVIMQNSFSGQLLQYLSQINPQTGAIDTSLVIINEDIFSSVDDQDLLTFGVSNDLTGQVTLTMNETVNHAAVRLMDMNGRIIDSRNLSLSIGANVLNYDGVINGGQYVLFLVDKETGRFRSEKIVIIR